VTLDRDTPTLPTEKTRPKNIEKKKKIKRNKIRKKRVTIIIGGHRGECFWDDPSSSFAFDPSAEFETDDEFHPKKE
jgi:hypothetical protein